MTEADLAKKFIEYFSDQGEIFPEVNSSFGIIDFVVRTDRLIIAVEVKKTFSIDVIEQAYRHLYNANYSYVAVPATKNKSDRSFGEIICRKFGIGVLKYSERTGQIIELVPPRLIRKIDPPKLHEWMKQSTAGSQTDRMTAFKNTVQLLEREAKHHPGIKITEALKYIGHHYSSNAVARNSVSKYINDGIIKTLELKNGQLFLKEVK